MKKTIISLILAALCTSLSAQVYDVLERIKENPELAAGNNATYNFDVPALTKAPKGYEVAYISHYARHGSRYAWEDIYSRVDTVLHKIGDAGLLTPYGEDFLRKTDSLVVITKYHIGELCQKGWDQHKRIAEVMVESFPEFFSKGPYVRATSSHSQRSIMSMASFCLGLEAAAPKSEIYEEIGENWYWEVIPHDDKNPFRKRYVHERAPFDMTGSQYVSDRLDLDAILSKLIKDPAAAEQYMLEGTDPLRHTSKKMRLVYELYEMLCGMYSIDNPVGYDKLFSYDEWVTVWEMANFNQYNFNMSPYHVYPVVESIVTRAQAALEKGQPAVDLRFGHDTVLVPLTMLLSINNCRTVADKPEDAKIWFQNFNIPMAGNVQFILYRNKKNHEDVLFKLLVNGIEGVLPLQSVQGPYYRWSDFVAYAATLKRESDDSDRGLRGHAPLSPAGSVPTSN